ncbi:MAG: hypothetical protein REI96_14755 [Flavobacterium nitrogenifigens]|uniref:YD repeat-containing protein n=1 Tax=Flavobacterium nitrogenifigens TaxID=1617283 RepID=A0A521EWH3_9FLAO|nr:hypothetical protein [Flavobacterium nitrogenifigens]KAF2333413.1 hypothetical protein DM397_09755 [Flavobacterium nitrogenifigens]MDQ8013710.1 hypothetical protein [Flavobacterium nitrogenifigens]SMO87440.1 hypothetical protein SAMN06265220_105101 [Flavobacterium nitrogenifigens]
MKKLIPLFGVLALLLVSCTSDENSSLDAKDDTFPKSIITTYSGSPSDTTFITYKEDKIESMTTKKNKIYFFYEGGLIQSKQYYEIVQGKESKTTVVTYFYENGKLAASKFISSISIDYPNGKFTGRNVYTFISDTLIKEQRFDTDQFTNIEKESDTYDMLIYKNGNVRRRTTVNAKTSLDMYTQIYAYDNKNSPFKNIKGVNLLIADEMSSSNNILTISSNTNFVYDKNTYEYNDKEYPSLKTYYKGGGEQVSSTTKYLY